MNKEATIIQSFNDVKQQYEYSVKGYNVTESVKILLKRHKEAYDKEKYVFASIDGYLEAQKEYQSKIVDLQSQLAEKDKEIERLKELVMHKTYNRNAVEARLNYEQNQKAIEELERLKSAILSERNTTYFKFDNFNKGKDTAYYWVNEIIDNQIKSLRGEK